MITGRHELLESYLADLDRRLAGADPGERADILSSVREHVETELAGLGRPATPQDEAAILDRLGSVDAVAAAWSPEPADGVVPGRPRPTPRPPAAPLVVTAAVLAGASVVLLGLPPIGAVLGVVAVVLGVIALRRHLEPRWASITAVAVGASSAVLGLIIVVGALALFTLRSGESEAPAPVESVEVVTPAD